MIRSKTKGEVKMTEHGWTTNRPQQAGMYHMRKIGENEGQTIEVIPPNKGRTLGGGEIQDLPDGGYEYKPSEGEGGPA